MFGQPSFNPMSPFYIGHYDTSAYAGGDFEPLLLLFALIPMTFMVIFAAFSGVMRRQMIVSAVILLWIVAAILYHSNK